MAELLFRGWVDPLADATVASAGVRALVGHGIDSSSATALAQLGIDPSSHRARQFEPSMAERADLILAATLEQRDIVMTAVPMTLRRTFTMKEFVRLLNGVPRAAPAAVVSAAVVSAAAARRGRVPLVAPHDDDVRDPYRSAIPHAKAVAEEITETVYATVSALGFAAEGSAYQAPVHTTPSGRPVRY